MPDLTLAIRLTAGYRVFVDEVRASQAKLDKLARTTDRAGQRTTRRMSAGCRHWRTRPATKKEG